MLPMRSFIRRYLLKFFLSDCHFLLRFFWGVGKWKHERSKKNANLKLRLLIRITTENPTARIIFIIARFIAMVFSLEWNYRGWNKMNPRMLCSLIRFPAPFMCRRSCIVLIDLSDCCGKRRKRCRLCWCLCFAGISHIKSQLKSAWTIQITFVILCANCEFEMTGWVDARCRSTSTRDEFKWVKNQILLNYWSKYCLGCCFKIIYESQQNIFSSDSSANILDGAKKVVCNVNAL